MSAGVRGERLDPGAKGTRRALKAGLPVGLLAVVAVVAVRVVDLPSTAPEGDGKRSLHQRGAGHAGSTAPGMKRLLRPELGQEQVGASEQGRAADAVARRSAGDTEDEDDHAALRAVLEGDAWLSSYWDFRNRPLMDADSRASYRALLSDPRMHEKVRQDLLAPEPTGSATRRNLQQLVEVDYLRDAIAWDGNPLREELLELVSTLITEDNFVPGSDADLRRTKAAVKRELYELLADVDPARAAAVVDEARGTRLEGLVAFLAGHRSRRMQKNYDVERKPGGG